MATPNFLGESGDSTRSPRRSLLGINFDNIGWKSMARIRTFSQLKPAIFVPWCVKHAHRISIVAEKTVLKIR